MGLRVGTKGGCRDEAASAPASAMARRDGRGRGRGLTGDGIVGVDSRAREEFACQRVFAFGAVKNSVLDLQVGQARLGAPDKGRDARRKRCGKGRAAILGIFRARV